MNKNSQEVGIEEKHHNIMKTIKGYSQLTSSGDGAFPLRPGMRQGRPISILPVNKILEVLARAMR